MVKSIARGGKAQVAGIQPKDIITKINGTPIKNTKELSEVMKKLNDESTITLIVLRNDDFIAVDIQ